MVGTERCARGSIAENRWEVEWVGGFRVSESARQEMAGWGGLRRAGQAAWVPLLARQAPWSVWVAARVNSLHSLCSSPGTYHNVPVAPVAPVQEALAEFDFLATPLRLVSVMQEDQTMALLSPIGWPSSMLIDDGTGFCTQFKVILTVEKGFRQ